MNSGIHIQELKKTYRAPGGPVPAVRGIDVSIAPGETVATVVLTALAIYAYRRDTGRV